MNKTKYYIVIIMLLLVGCSKSNSLGNSEQEVVVEFPSLQVISAEIGGEYTLSFDAATSWSIASDVTWIDFRSSGVLYSLLEGGAAQGCEVIFEVSDANYGFSDAVGSITLSMGDQEAVIATVLRSGKEFSLVFNTINPLSFIWSDQAQRFEAELSFEANFDWYIDLFPSWVASPEVVQGSAGETYSVTLSTLLEAYTFEEQMASSLNVVYSEDSSVGYPVEMSAPGAEGMMIITDGRGIQTFSFEADAATKQSYDIAAIVEGDSSSQSVFAILDDGSAADWVTIESPSQWEDIQYGDCLKKISREVSVGVNSAADSRTATIYVLPTSIYKQYADCSQVADNCSQYIVAHITQQGAENREDEETLEEDNNEEESSDLTLEFTQGSPNGEATITKMSSSHELYQYFTDTHSIPDGAIFILEYCGSSLSEQINFPFEFNWDRDSIEIGLLSACASGEQGWLSVSASNSYFTVSMNSSIAAEGFILLQQSLENRVAIYCVQTM